MGIQSTCVDYSFKIQGTTAVGTLPDGTKFLIDAADVGNVSKRFWHVKDGRYIISSANGGNGKARLHRYILGIKDKTVIVDHINRNRFDCRRENLRIVTLQQNNMNRSIGRNNSTGYVGVVFLKDRKCYRAKISLNNRNIVLGTSADPIICAQMYNAASAFLHREYGGHHNDVPPPSPDILKKVYEKCKPYMKQADLATQPCGLFLCIEEDRAS